MSTKQLTGKLALLMWVQKIASEYGIKVENFTSHFKDSRVLCAIINYYFPDELDFKSIKSDTQEEILNNFKAAFDIAEKHGVIKLLDPEDMLTPDTNSVMLYMAGMNKAFKPLPKGISSTKKEEALKEIIQDIPFQNIKQNVLQNLNINLNNNTNESSEEKEKLEKLEKERQEKERQEKEKQEKERLEKEKQEKERQEKERQEKEKQEKERLEKERQEKEIQEKEIQEKIEKEKQEKEKFEKERERQELLEKERQQKEKLERERLEIERLEKERQENVKMEKEERQNLIQLEKQEKERQEKENQERERQQKEKQESFEKTNIEKNKQPSEVKFQPSMVLSFLYLILGYFISGYLVDYTLFNFYFYIVLGIFFAISKWKPEINIFPILFSYLPYLLLILSNLDLQLIDLSLFIKSVLISKNLFKVHHYLTFIVSFLSSKVVLPLQDLLGIQTGGWSLSVFFVSRMVLFVIGIFF